MIYLGLDDLSVGWLPERFHKSTASLRKITQGMNRQPGRQIDSYKRRIGYIIAILYILNLHK